MLEDSEAAKEFIDRIIDAKLAGTEIEPEIRATLHKNLLERLENQIISAVIERLNQHQQVELEHLLDEDKIDQIEGFLVTCGINLNQLLSTVMIDFQASYLGV